MKNTGDMKADRMNARIVAINGLLAVLILSTALISRAGEVLDFTRLSLTGRGL